LPDRLAKRERAFCPIASQSASAHKAGYLIAAKRDRAFCPIAPLSVNKKKKIHAGFGARACILPDRLARASVLDSGRERAFCPIAAKIERAFCPIAPLSVKQERVGARAYILPDRSAECK
jgi:hypothetical protein